MLILEVVSGQPTKQLSITLAGLRGFVLCYNVVEHAFDVLKDRFLSK
jgi:hypothetical protein